MIKLKEQEFEKKLSWAEKVPKILHSNEFMEFFPISWKIFLFVTRPF